MNYRHAFHAGNHGDVLKHVVLTRVLGYLMQKEAALAVLDAHAGIGLYDVLGPEAFKTGEWRQGIGKLLARPFDGDVAELLAPYVNAVRAENQGGALLRYPGSSRLLQVLLRPQDRLMLNELHPQDFETLRRTMGNDARLRLSAVDAGQSVRASLPFVERRGLVLLDPAYEVTDESERVARMLRDALKRMASACVMIWYPVTTEDFAKAFVAGLNVTGAKAALQVELRVRRPKPEGGMAGSGLVIVNPPWTLHDELQVILPELAKRLGEEKDASSQLQWLLPPG